jgi:hypothetical protein
VPKFNLFVLYGSKDNRGYDTLYPVPQHALQGQKFDFHYLEYFKPFSFSMLLGEEWKKPEADRWLMEKTDVQE